MMEYRAVKEKRLAVTHLKHNQQPVSTLNTEHYSWCVLMSQGQCQGTHFIVSRCINVFNKNKKTH